MPQITETQAAYIAGCLDSDGHIGIMRRQRKGQSAPYLRPIVQFGQKRTTVQNWMMEVTGAGATQEHRKGNFFNLRFHAGTLRWLLPQVYPFLVLKRRQAELAMEFLSLSSVSRNGVALTDEQKAKREAMRFECELLNKKYPSSEKVVDGGTVLRAVA